ncbi:MAG TPA: hypothetical protein VJ225_03175 [Nitrososphaeraceae archaeon]|nr:hypothetical protein [Nitrososphaeraceae archaeon]
MSKTSGYMENNELVSNTNTNTNNQQPVRNYAKGRLVLQYLIVQK